MRQRQYTLHPKKKRNSWTSVDVKDELPVIAGGDTPKGPPKKGNVSDSAVKTAPTKKKIYYEYIDSGNHFCRHCLITCNTLSQFFQHFHGKRHARVTSKLPKPWDDQKVVKDKKQKVGQAQSRRIKGAEFIIPVIGSYCSLCKVFCGDLNALSHHVKNDSHYEKYLDYIRDNPNYEKNLLLEKTKAQPASNLDKKSSGQEKEEKGREKKAHLRVKTQGEVEKEEEDLGLYDQIGAIDMELDEDDRDDDIDVLGKVPKMVPKSLPFVPPPPPEPAITDTMKTSKEDKVQPLDTFLTIKQETNGPATSVKGEKIPVVSSKTSIDLSCIPVPEVHPPRQVYTVKSLQEVQDEEKQAEVEKRKALDEEKKMMGIDVDAEEEKPLAAIRRPPIFQNLSLTTSETSEESRAIKSEPKKTTSVDNLFAKLNKSAAQKRKPKVASVAENQTTEMELRIQQEIAEKVSKEKEKLLRIKLKEEERERRREERKLQKKKIYSSSESSSEESEEEHAGEGPANEVQQIHLPLSQNLLTDQKPTLEAEASSTVDEPSSGFVINTPANECSQKEVQIMSEDEPKSDEVREEKSSPEVTKDEISEVIKGVEGEKTYGVPIETLRKGRAPIKKKNSSGSVSVATSDLFDVFSSSLETVSQEARKKLSKKGGAKKRGKGPKACQETEGREIIMEDYVVLSEVHEEDEVGRREETEMKDEIGMEDSAEIKDVEMKDGVGMEEDAKMKDEFGAVSTSYDTAIEMEKGSHEVVEVEGDAEVTKNTSNQELEIENLSKPDVKETLKSKTTSGKELFGNDGHLKPSGDKEQEEKIVEELSTKSSDNEQSDRCADKVQKDEPQVLSTSAVDQEVPPESEKHDNEKIPDEHEELKGLASSQVEMHADEVLQEELQMLTASPVNQELSESEKHDYNKIPDEHKDLIVPASSQGGKPADEVQQEELQMLTPSLVNQEVLSETDNHGNEKIPHEHVEIAVLASSHDEKDDEIKQEEPQALSALIADQEVLPESENRDCEMIPAELEEVTVPAMSQDEKHADEVLQEELQVLTASPVNQVVLSEAEENDNEKIPVEHKYLIIPASSQGEKPADEIQQEELQVLTPSLVNQEVPSETENQDNEKIPHEHVEITLLASSHDEKDVDEVLQGEPQALSASIADQEVLLESEKHDCEKIPGELEELTVPAMSQDENHADEVLQEELQVLTASPVNQEVLSGAEEHDNKIPDEREELTVPVLSQEVPVKSDGEPSELKTPTLVQEVSPASEKDTENASEEKSPVLTVTATGRGGGRGRGKKSGGRGRGRGKRAAKKGRVGDSALIDESAGKADEPQELGTQSMANTTAISTNEEPEIMNVPSPSKRGRRGRAPSASRRVTRSRVNQNVGDTVDSIMNEPAEAVVKEQEPDMAVMAPSSAACEADSLAAGVKSMDEQFDIQHFSTEVGVESPKTTSFNSNVPMEDIQMIPTLAEQPNLCIDGSSLLECKEGSDSDATITEDQEIVESQIIFDDSKNQNALILPQVPIISGMEPLDSLVGPADACVDPQSNQSQKMPVADNSSVWDQTYQDGCDSENTSTITVVQQDVSPATSHIHASQPRDPPMSGIVSEVEDLDNIMDVDGEGADDPDMARPEAVISESEFLPTSGLGLDIEDVTDSISFPLEDDNTKTDPNESL